MTDTITARLATVQSQLRAPKGQYNSFSKYHYRSAEDIIEAVKPLVHAQGMALTVSDELMYVGDRYYVKATATVRGDGESVSVCGFAREAVARKGMDDSQITGSASSYARKYALNGLFAIDDTKDADSAPPQRPQATQAPAPAPSPQPAPSAPQGSAEPPQDYSSDPQWQRASASLHAKAADVVGQQDAHDVLHIMATLAEYPSLKNVPVKRLVQMREFITGEKWPRYYQDTIEPALADMRLTTKDAT